jgi:error-prone DNA polymerase
MRSSKMPLSEVVADYQMLRLSLKAHRCSCVIASPAKVLSCADTNAAPDGRREGARHRPHPPAAGQGQCCVHHDRGRPGGGQRALWARDMEKQRCAVMASRLMRIGHPAQQEDVVHLWLPHHRLHRSADYLSDNHRADPQLARADEVARPQAPRASSPRAPGRSAGHPRNVRILPKSRDFH